MIVRGAPCTFTLNSVSPSTWLVGTKLCNRKTSLLCSACKNSKWQPLRHAANPPIPPVQQQEPPHNDKQPTSSKSSASLSSSTSFQAPPQTQATPAISTIPFYLQKLRDHLYEQLPLLFQPTHTPNYTLYSPNVIFIDPLNTFRNLQSYETNIQFLKNSSIFTNTSLTLHNITIPYTSVQQNMLITRWTLSLTFKALLWEPRLIFTGISEYTVDEVSGLVTKHVDKWDSIVDNEYFSWEAVVDLVRQSLPWRIERSLNVDEDIVVVRRRKSYEIWEIRGTKGVGRGVEEIWRVGKDEKGEFRAFGEDVVGKDAVAVLGFRVWPSVAVGGKGFLTKERLLRFVDKYKELTVMLKQDGTRISRRDDFLFWIVRGNRGLVEIWITVDDY